MLITGFKMFSIFRGNEDLGKLTVCSVLKRKIILQGLAEEHTSTSEHFLRSDNVLPTYFSIQNINPNSELLYQKKTSRVKAAEEPEQNSTETCLFSTRASKASRHHSSAQDACYKSILSRHVLTGRFALWLWQDHSHFQL